jgi:hypothetical protein
MNAVQMLSLRKPDRRFDSVSRTDQSTSNNSKFSKKNNIKEILVRNFFRKFPIGVEISDMDQIRIEKEAANEFETFVKCTKDINSKNLQAFEATVAQKLKLKRIQTTQSVDQRGKGQSFASPAYNKYPPLISSNVRESVINAASQGNLANKINKRPG